VTHAAFQVAQVGKTQLYQLNNDNPKSKMILMLERFIVSERLGKLTDKEGVSSQFVSVPQAEQGIELISQ